MQLPRHCIIRGWEQYLDGLFIIIVIDLILYFLVADADAADAGDADATGFSSIVILFVLHFSHDYYYSGHDGLFIWCSHRMLLASYIVDFFLYKWI